MISEEELESIVSKRTQKQSKEEWASTQRTFDPPLYDYRLAHTKNVVSIAKKLGKANGANMQVVVLAAWLHDIAKPGLYGIDDHGKMSASIARDLLKRRNIDEDVIERVCEAISEHAGLTLNLQLDTIESQVLWEADKLDKLGIIGFIHYIINGIRIRKGMYIEDMADSLRDFLPLAESIANSMYTPMGQKIAKERLVHLKQVSELLDYEIIEHQSGE